jgi:hypothetical protein
MKVIFGIVFAVLFGLVGARFAGPIGDWMIATQVFESPDQVANFDLIVRLGVTLVIALTGAFVGILIGGRLKRYAIRTES